MKRRSGMGVAMIVAALVVVVVVAGVGVYAFVFHVAGGSETKSTTLTIGTVRSTGTPATRTSTIVVGSVTSAVLTSDTQSYQTYTGTFSYVVPLGPSGINDSTGKPIQWNSTQTASGSFTFSINPATYLGTGSGQGSIRVATRGYCTGSPTVPYTFAVQAGHLPGGNFEIAFETPSPSNVTVRLSCLGPTTGFYTANNPVSFLSVYPNEESPASIPMTDSQTLTGGISYTVTIT